MAKYSFNCPQCGATVSVEEQFSGTVIRCPACDKGIVVPGVEMMTAEEDDVIPPEDFAKALTASRQNSEFETVFNHASKTAKLFLGLKAYCLQFGTNFDNPNVSACLIDIESDLTADDIEYLIANENDSYVRDVLTKIMSRRKVANLDPEPMPSNANPLMRRPKIDLSHTKGEMNWLDLYENPWWKADFDESFCCKFIKVITIIGMITAFVMGIVALFLKHGRGGLNIGVICFSAGVSCFFLLITIRIVGNVLTHQRQICDELRAIRFRIKD